MIKFKELAHYKHVKVLMALEKEGRFFFKLVHESLTKQIKKKLKNQRLTKSNKLKNGWTGEIPKIDVDLDDLLGPVIDKHLSAIRFALLGKYAGKQALEDAKDLGLINKVTPGLIPAAYLESIDTHMEHYEDLFEKKAKEPPKAILKASMEEIVKRARRFVDQTLTEYKNKLTVSIESNIGAINFENVLSAMDEAKEALPEVGAEAAVEKAAEGIVPKIDKSDLDKILNGLGKEFEDKLEKAVQVNTSLASAVGAHEAITEIFGKESEVRVVIMAIFDERTCDFCPKVSKNSKGDWIYYKPSDLMPAGYNFVRKKREWKQGVTPLHWNCRCATLIVPPGFMVDESGNVIPAKK